MKKDSVAEFTFYVPLKSKARPRFVKGSVPYMPKDYMEWKADLTAQMKEWWTAPPLEKVKQVTLHFGGPARHDGDNLCGAVLDAGLGVIWKDDRVSILPHGVWIWNKTKPKDSYIHLQVTY